VESEGRHRYYRLASAAVAEVIEGLAQLAQLPLPLTLPGPSPAARALRFAPMRYNHLAGELAGPLGTQLFKCWCEKGWLKQREEQPRLIEVTALGRQQLRTQLGIR
jgi:hypothetical protein